MPVITVRLDLRDVVRTRESSKGERKAPMWLGVSKLQATVFESLREQGSTPMSSRKLKNIETRPAKPFTEKKVMGANPGEQLSDAVVRALREKAYLAILRTRP